MSDGLCPYCLRWHHAVDDCEPEAVLGRWFGIEPARQERADHAEADVIRHYRRARKPR